MDYICFILSVHQKYVWRMISGKPFLDIGENLWLSEKSFTSASIDIYSTPVDTEGFIFECAFFPINIYQKCPFPNSLFPILIIY